MANSTTGNTTDQSGKEKDRAWYHELEQTFLQRTAAKHAAHLLPHIKPEDKILDVGCGPGTITLDLARLVPDGHVTGVDIGEDWITASSKAAEERGIGNVTFGKGNILDLSQFADDTFDIVHEHQVLLHITTPVEAIKEMRRVAKPGGIVSIRDNQYRTHYPTGPFLQKMQQQYADFMETVGLDPNLGSRLHICAHEAGFEWNSIEMSSWGWEHSGPGGRKAWAHQAASSVELFMRKKGNVSEAELQDVWKGYGDWSQLPEARFIALDTALICRK